MSDAMFEKASRQAIRFATSMGALSAEDLWQLPLTSNRQVNLDDIAKGLHKQLKSGEDISFVNPDKKSDEGVQLRFDLVKHIIDSRLAERAAAAAAEEKKAKKQLLLGILADKQSDAYKAMTPEELQKAISEL